MCTPICTTWIKVRILRPMLCHSHITNRTFSSWSLAPPTIVNIFFPQYNSSFYNLHLPCLWSSLTDYITCLCWRINSSIFRACAVSLTHGENACTQSLKLLIIIRVGIFFRNDSHWASGRMFPFPGLPFIRRHVIHTPMCLGRQGQTHCLIKMNIHTKSGY